MTNPREHHQQASVFFFGGMALVGSSSVVAPVASGDHLLPLLQQAFSAVSLVTLRGGDEFGAMAARIEQALRQREKP